MKKGRLNISELFDKISTLLFILPIRFYQIFISPLFPPTCRHIPTCSEYAVQAIKIHGIFYGTWLALKRLSRCHPWGTSGYDPVPPKRPKKSKSKK